MPESSSNFSYQNWYELNRGKLSQDGLWLRGGEINTLPPEEYDARSLRMMFVRLSTYADTGFSFTHQLLYQLAAEVDDVFPDLGYLPPPKDAAIFDKDKIPWLLGTQSKRGPEGFDVIGFSNSIVQELINVPMLLKKSGIPLEKSERMKRDDIPLLLLGGANSLYSSCLWLDEAVVDGVFVGESDQGLKQIMKICRDCKAQGLPKSQWLEKLEEVAGFFQPDKPRDTKKNFALDLNTSETLETAPILYKTDQIGSAHLQISEGCPCFCSFCAEAWERRPYRERRAPRLKEIALKLKASMGLETIDIYSFNFNMHSDLYSVLWDLLPLFKQIGLKSQRFDLLAHDPELVEIQHVLDKTSLTCGLEGISPRLREYLNKNLNSEELHASMESIFKSRARELKIFLIATGLEEEQDFVALADLCEHIQDIQLKTGSRTRVIFSMTPLVRFPWTPLEFEAAHSMEKYDGIISESARRIRAHGFEFREAADLPEYWVSQVLVRADQPSVSRALRKAAERTGFVFYREVTETFRKALETALLEEGLNSEDLLKGFNLEESRKKPWARVSTGVHREYLWKMFEGCAKFKEIDYCLGRSWTKAKCSKCGGCPTPVHVRNIVLAKQARTHTAAQFKEKKTETLKAETRVSFVVNIAEKGRGVPRKMLGVATARALMLAEPALTEGYRGYAGSVWDADDTPVWVSGDERIDLTFLEPSLALLRERLAQPEFIARVNSWLNGWGKLSGEVSQDWRPARILMETSSTLNMGPFLMSQGLKHIYKKVSDGEYIFELVPQARKKGVIGNIRFSKGTGLDQRPSYQIELGPKFDWQRFESDFLRRTPGFQFASSRIEALN